MIPSLSVSKAFQLLLLYYLLSILHRPSCAEPPYSNCSNTANNSVTSTSFQDNLKNLFHSLSSKASLSTFYNDTVGTDPNIVYGSYLCFVMPDACKSCVDLAIQNIESLCPNRKEAIVWEEYCQLRYSNKNFFGKLDNSKNLPLSNERNVSEPDLYRYIVGKMLGQLSMRAAFDPSARMFATEEANVTKIGKVHGFVQCTKDLSGNDCMRCLHTATREIRSCCYFSRGARVLSTSCYLRYELYPFYQGSSGLVDSPLSPSIPSSPSIPTTAQEKGDGRNVWTMVIIVIASAFVAVALLGYGLYSVWEKKGTRKEENKFIVQEAPLPVTGAPTSTDISYQNIQERDQMKSQDFPLIDFASISAATDNFCDSNKLGQGGFGPVYKGTLPDGKEVAVKRLSSTSEQGLKEFMNEVLLIMKLQHKNLVRLLGCCIEGEEKMLIYEFMPNGSLDVFLFDPKKRAQLDWRSRLNIIGGIARGILYLHEDSRHRIIHRDLKASNVLLDQDMNPKISDFGMARIFGGNESVANTARIVGTYGYMAPEYAMEGLYSIKSDVYSFGVILLEIVTGRRNAGFHLSELAPSLLAYAWHLWSEGKGLELMDPLLTESCCKNEFLRCIHIGLLCVQEDAIDRPTMSSAVVMLRNESVALEEPRRPAFTVGRFTGKFDYSQASALNFSINELTLSGVLPR